MKRRRRADVKGQTDDYSISTQPDGKDGEGSGVNVVSITHPTIRHPKPKSE